MEKGTIFIDILNLVSETINRLKLKNVNSVNQIILRILGNKPTSC